MVNRCICYDVSFKEIAELAREGKSFEQICELTSCCRGCNCCEPYVRVVIKTHVHAVPVMSPAQQDAVMADVSRQESGARSAAKQAPDKAPPDL